MNEPIGTLCRECDGRLWEVASFRCGYHEAGPLCGYCWARHIASHERCERVIYCWDSVSLPLKW